MLKVFILSLAINANGDATREVTAFTGSIEECQQVTSEVAQDVGSQYESLELVCIERETFTI